MADWLIILFLILGGIGIIIIEILFIPGTTIVGFLGLGIGSYGIFRSYELFGAAIGHYVAAGSIVLGIASVVVCFNSDAWHRFALTDTMKVNVNDKLTEKLVIGQEGVTKSSLKPVGKAAFDDKEYQVCSLGNFVEENQPVRIINIQINKVTVEPINI